MCAYLFCCVASACKHDGVEFDMSLMDFADSLTPEEFSHIYKADGAVSRQLGTYAYACGNNHTAVCKERANAPRTSTLSMREEKAGAYESSPGNI